MKIQVGSTSAGRVLFLYSSQKNTLYPLHEQNSFWKSGNRCTSRVYIVSARRKWLSRPCRSLFRTKDALFPLRDGNPVRCQRQKTSKNEDLIGLRAQEKKNLEENKGLRKEGSHARPQGKKHPFLPIPYFSFPILLNALCEGAEIRGRLLSVQSGLPPGPKAVIRKAEKYFLTDLPWNYCHIFQFCLVFTYRYCVKSRFIKHAPMRIVFVRIMHHAT